MAEVALAVAQTSRWKLYWCWQAVQVSAEAPAPVVAVPDAESLYVATGRLQMETRC